MEHDEVIPLGTFIELTWRPAGPEPDDGWDSHYDYSDGESAELIGIVGDEPVPSDVIWSDSAWKSLGDLND